MFVLVANGGTAPEEGLAATLLWMHGTPNVVSRYGPGIVQDSQ